MAALRLVHIQNKMADDTTTESSPLQGMLADNPELLQTYLSNAAAGARPGTPPIAPAPGGTPEAPNLGTGIPPPNQADLNLGTSPAADQQGQKKGPPAQSNVPALYGFMKQMFGGQEQRGYQDAPAGQPGRPVSRLDAFENFLGNFLNSFSQGMAQGGTGPGAAGRGFGAAVQAPYQRQVQQYQMAQQQQAQQSQLAYQQAETQRTQAEAQLKTAEAQPVTLEGPDGKERTLPGSVAKGILAADVAGQWKVKTAKTTGESREKVAEINQGIRMPVPPEIAQQVGIAPGTMLGKAGWDNVNKKLAAQGKNLYVGDIGNGHIGIMNKTTGQVTKDMGVGQYVKRAEASAYFQAKFGVTPIQQEDPITGDTRVQYVSRLAAPGQTPATNAFQIVKGKAGLNNYQDALTRISDNLGQMDDPGQRALIAKTLQQIGTNADPGMIAATVGNYMEEGLTQQSADLVAATLQAREFIGANRQFAGQLQGSQALYQRMASNVPGPMNSAAVNRALIKQDLANTDRIKKSLSTYVGNKNTPTGGGTSKVDALASKYGAKSPAGAP